MTKKHSGLVRRGGIWYVRKRVPDDLRDQIGKREIQISLRTGDKKLALERYWPTATEIEQKFATARRKQSNQQITTISVEQAEKFAFAWYQQQFGDLDNSTRTAFGKSDIKEELSDLGILENALLEDDEAAVMPMLQGEADGFLIAQGFPSEKDDLTGEMILSSDFDKSSDGYQRFIQLIRRGNLDAVLQQRAILQGTQRRDPFFRQPVQRQRSADGSSQHPNSITVADLIERYLNSPWFEEGSRKRLDYEVACRVFAELVGAKRLVGSLTHDDFSDVFGVLKKLPPNFTKKARSRGKSIRVMAETNTGEALSVISINKYMAHISSLMEWAVKRGDAASNPANDKYLRAQRNPGSSLKKARSSFSDAQLKRIFSSQTYRQPDPSEPSMYWVPLIGLLHGMRMEEILQLRADDVREKDGVRFMRLHRENGNSLKNTNAERDVPIHDFLWTLSFETLIEKAGKSGDGRLFLDAPRGKSTGKFSSVYSRRFSRFLSGIEAEADRTAFHSFRHNFRDAQRNLQIPLDRILQIGGWSTGTGTHSIYGEGINLSELNTALQQVWFDGIGLEEIVAIDWTNKV